jgi:hypothetical protein
MKVAAIRTAIQDGILLPSMVYLIGCLKTVEIHSKHNCVKNGILFRYPWTSLLLERELFTYPTKVTPYMHSYESVWRKCTF